MDSLEKLRLERNIPKLYAYAFFQSFLVIMPVLVLYWQDKGLSLKEIFLLQGVFGAALLVFDLPAGYMADIFGRKLSLFLGAAISAIGFTFFCFGNTFWDFVLFEIVLGIGLSLQSGCDIALLYESMERLELSGRRASYLGKRLTFNTGGEGVASLIGGALAGFSLVFPAYVNAFTAWMPALIALTLYEPPTQRMSRESHITNFRNIGRALFGQSRLLTFAILNFIFYSFATYCVVWSLQPYWKARGISIEYFGYLWAANCFLVAVVARYAHLIEEKLGSTRVVLLICTLPIVGYFGMGLAPGLTGLVFILAFPLCRGLNQVIFQDAINTRVAPEIRATTNSIGSLGFRILFLFFGPLLGHILDIKGPDYAMTAMGYVYLAGLFLIALPLLAQRREFRLN